MKIAFNPSTVAALTSPPNNKDITFDLKGHNIFARGVKFYGTDTNTWRDIKVNNVSIGSNILDLRNGSNTTLTNTNGVVTINSTWRPVVDNLTSDSTTSSLSAKQGKVLKALIDGKSNSDHNHDGRYVRKSGDTMSGVLIIDTTNFGALAIKRSDDVNGASIQFRGKSNIYGYIGFNAANRNKQLLRWNGTGSQVYTILDTSSTYISGGKGVINGTTITQVDNADKLDGYHANTSQSPFGRVPTIGGDGAMEIGKYIDFHYDNEGKYDYSTRLQATGNHQNTLLLPSGTGTLALTSQIPNKNSWNYDDRYVRYYAVTTLDCNNLAPGLTAARVSATNAASSNHSAFLYISDVGTPFQIQIPDSSEPYIYKRCYGSGGWNGWFKLSAGYADSAGSVAWDNVTNKPATATRWPSWDEIANKPNTFTPSDHNHDGRYVYNYGGTQMNGVSVDKNALGMTTNSGVTGDWWHILQAAWNGEYRWNSQIAFPTQNRNGMYYRSGLDDNTAWGAWVKLLDSNNYSSILDIRYITDITTSVNKLTFTKNGSSIARTITVNNVQSLGKRSPLTERNAISGIYTYGTYSATDNLAPTNYFETLGFGEGVAGTIEIGGSWISGGKLYWRALRDYQENWFSWKTILDSSNYSSILDSRYYTESEVNDLLSKKLNTSDFNWTNLLGKIVAGNEFNIVNAGFKESMWFNYLPINDRSNPATINSYHFGNGNKGYTYIVASGFIKNGSNSSYVLLGDGGHQTISSLSVNYANGANYANSAGSATSATKVIVSQHTSNDINYPLVWSNQSHYSSITENQLYKSWADLYYNPKNRRLNVGGYFEGPWARFTDQNGALVIGDNTRARISAIGDQVIFNTGSAIRFGETAWDWDGWAGLKYTRVNKTIYLGIADGPTFNANTNQSGGTLNLRAGISTIQTPNINFGNITSGLGYGLEWTCGGNDFVRIKAGATGSNAGYLEIATADDGNEPIYVRQYWGTFGSVARTLTLLDANGYSHFPSYINIGGNENNNSSPDRVWGSNGSDSYLRSYRTSALRVAYASNSDTVDGYHATDGRTFNGNINWSSNWNDTWSDGTNKHPWYGFDHRYPNTQAYSTTISDYFGMTIKTANTLRLDCKDLLINGTNISNLNVASATNAYHLRINSVNSWSTWYWAGQGGQPTWLWGSNNGTNMYVWNPSNFNVNTAQYLRSLGNQNCQTGRTQNYGNIYSYNTREYNTGAPESYTSVIGFGRGAEGTVEIAGGWCNSNLHWRSLRDVSDNWYSWRTVLDSSNYTNFINNYYWANIKISTSANTQTTPSVNTIYANNWFRSQGASGWYSESYGGGIYMFDTTWIRTYGNKSFYCDRQIYSSDSIRMSDILLERANEINNITNGPLHLNYRNTGNVTLCNGGGAVTIGTTSTDIGGNKLFVNGSEFIDGASNVRQHVFAKGFRHRDHNSNDAVLLAGGGYSQGVPVKYWAIYSIYIGGSSTDNSYYKLSGNYNFISSMTWEQLGSAILNINFPSGYNKGNTLIFGNGDHMMDTNWHTPVYVTITTNRRFGQASNIRVMISDDSSFNTGFASIYFMCMG